MDVPTWLNVIGLSSNIIGTIILAFSLSDYIGAMRLALDAHELFIMSYLNNTGKPIVRVTGMDWHLKKGEKAGKYFTFLGVFLVILGFILQLIPLVPLLLDCTKNLLKLL